MLTEIDNLPIELEELVKRRKEDARYWRLILQEDKMNDINYWFKYCDLMDGATFEALKDAVEITSADDLARFIFNIMPVLAWWWDIDLSKDTK